MNVSVQQVKRKQCAKPSLHHLRKSDFVLICFEIHQKPMP